MARILTKKKLEDADIDVGHAGEAVNTKKVINPRYGEPFKSIPLLVEEGEAKITQAAQTITSATASIVSQKNQASEVISQAESDVATAAADVHQRGNQEIANLQNAIDIAAAAGAGANGWTAELVVDGNKNQKQINSEQQKKNTLTVDILEFVPQLEWAAIFSKTSNYDCGPALALAIATGKQAVINSRGLYKIKTAYNGTTDFDLKISEGVILDVSECSGSYAISNSGSVTKLSKTWGALTAGFHKVTFNDVSSLKIGDWLCFYDPTSYSYSLSRANYNDGEWKQIRRIVGNTVTFSEPFLKTYIAPLDLYKLNSVVCKIDGGEFINKSTTMSGTIRFSLSSNAQAHNQTADAKQNSVILFDRCIKPQSSNTNGTNEGAGTDDYFVTHSNCWDGYHNGGKFYSRRHAFAMGGGAGPCNVPNTRSIVENATLDCDIEATVGAADMHGNVRLSEYRNCTINGGAKIGGGEGNFYRGCKIISDSLGRCGFASEIVGGEYGWIDCEVVFTADPQQASGRGVFDIGGNGSPVDANTVKDQTIVLRGIKVSDTGVTLNNTSLLKFVNRGTTKKVNVHVDDITLNTTSKFYHAVAMSASLDSGATASSDYIICTNIKGNLPENMVLSAAINSQGVGYLNQPMRIQKQTAISAGITTANTQVNLAQTVLPIRYPRLPAVSLALRKKGGASASTIGGQQNVSVGVFNMDNYRVTPRISSTTAMTAGDEVEVAITAEIAEC